jgi:hypothetical protein
VIPTTYRVDIDGTIAEPRFFDDDLRTCCDWYVNEGIVTPEEVTSFQRHQQLFLLPHVLVTHIPLAGSVEALQELYLEEKTLQYFTVRQALDPEVCARVHGNTHAWLRDLHFPCPDQVRFFWDAGHKLTESLKAREDQIILIDDRPDGLIDAYQNIAEKDPGVAQQICQRVRLLAFGSTNSHADFASPLQVIALKSWSSFYTVRAELEREPIYGHVS